MFILEHCGTKLPEVFRQHQFQWRNFTDEFVAWKTFPYKVIMFSGLTSTDVITVQDYQINMTSKSSYTNTIDLDLNSLISSKILKMQVLRELMNQVYTKQIRNFQGLSDKAEK